MAWDRRTGDPLHRAIVWQDRRTAAACRALVEPATSPWSGSGPGWSSTPTSRPPRCSGCSARVDCRPARRTSAFGTVDSWVLWNLTGGADGGVFATDATNASRTMLFDIVVRRWSAELCDLFGVPESTLPEVRPSCGRLGRVSESALGADSPLPG